MRWVVFEVARTVNVSISPAATAFARCRQTIAVAWPIVLMSITTVVLGATDTALLGRYSIDALAAATVAVPIWIVLTAIVIPWGSATQVLVAQWHGAGDNKSISDLTTVGVAAAAALGGLIAVLGILLTPLFVAAVSRSDGIDTHTAEGIVRMLLIFCASLPFTAVTAHLRGILSGMGETEQRRRSLCWWRRSIFHLHRC